MELDLVYLNSECGIVKKDGSNFGKEYYLHRFMYQCDVVNFFEFADSEGNYKILKTLNDMKLEYLDKCVGEFDLYVTNNKLQLKLADIR